MLYLQPKGLDLHSGRCVRGRLFIVKKDGKRTDIVINQKHGSESYEARRPLTGEMLAEAASPEDMLPLLENILL